MYWLDTSPGIETAPASGGPCTVTGRCPQLSPGVTRTPSWTSASWSGANARRRSAGKPSIVTGPLPSAASAVRNREVVPASAAWTSISPIPRGSPIPVNRTRVPAASTTAPIAVRPASMAAVSSPSGTFASSLVPGASAAHTSARLAIDFEPGTATTASTGPSSRRTRRAPVITRAASRRA
jgi:hypothetical protein